MKSKKNFMNMVLNIMNVIVTIVPYVLLGVEVGGMAVEKEAVKEGHLLAGLRSGWTY